MTWKCSQCGEINKADIVKCFCGYEELSPELIQNTPLSIKTDQPVWIARDVFIMFFGILVIDAILNLFFRFVYKSYLLEYYIWVALQCFAIYSLNQKYPIKVTAFVEVNKIVKYGIGTTVALLIFRGAKFFDNTLKLPHNYDLYLSYSVLLKSLFIFNLVILAPVVEEFLFRECFYRILKHRYNILWATVLSTAFFSVGHNFALSSILFGLFFALIYEKSGSVWGSITAHFLLNASYAIKYFI